MGRSVGPPIPAGAQPGDGWKMTKNRCGG